MLRWLTGVAVLAVAGAALQRMAEARDRRRYPAPGRQIRVGDAELHVVVEGSGPVVLIDSGLGGSSIEWAEVAANLADEFTVVRYDRPGFAWSAPSSTDRRAVAAATRILELLAAVGLPGPAILVGHSLGGVHVRVAAALAPAQVSGLVLVDPSHEGMLATFERSKAAGVTRWVLRLMARSAPLGVGRLAGRGFARLALTDRRQPLQPAQLQGARLSGLLTCRTVHGLHALSAEHAALADSLRQVAEVTEHHPEPEVPLTVITANSPSENPRVMAARTEIDGLHAQLAHGRRFGRQVFAERSGHLVPLDQPEIITKAVRETAAAISARAWVGEVAT